MELEIENTIESVGEQHGEPSVRIGRVRASLMTFGIAIETQQTMQIIEHDVFAIC